MTAFSDVTAGLVVALAGLAGGRVYRGHAWPLPTGVESMLWVRPERSASERTGITGGPVDWTTTYSVEIRQRYTPDTEAPDTAVDALLGSVYAALASYSAAGVQDVVPGVEVFWDYSDSDLNVVGATLNLTVIHRTESQTLTAWT